MEWYANEGRTDGGTIGQRWKGGERRLGVLISVLGVVAGDGFRK